MDLQAKVKDLEKEQLLIAEKLEGFEERLEELEEKLNEFEETITKIV